MFLQVLGSPLVAYSRILVGPFSSPGDREFLLSTFGHVGSPPRHLKVGNKTWENVEKCGEKCGNWEISRSGDHCWLKLLQLLPFQGTPECRKKTTTPWSLFPQTSRSGFGDQVHQLKNKKLRHDKDSEKVQEAVHGVLNISHPVCVESRFRSFIWRPSSSSICQPSKVEGTTMKTSKKIQTCWTTSNLWQKRQRTSSIMEARIRFGGCHGALMSCHGCVTGCHGCHARMWCGGRHTASSPGEGLRFLRFQGDQKNNMMDTQSKNKVLFIMMLVMSFHHRHQRYIFAMSFSGWFWLVVFLSRPKIPPSRKPLFSSHAGRVLAPCFSGAGLASGSSTTEVGVLWKWAQLWPLNEVVELLEIVGLELLAKKHWSKASPFLFWEPIHFDFLIHVVKIDLALNAIIL